MMGAGELACESEENFTTLRENVTSKGGTTAAALKSFETNKLGGIWKRGMDAAYKRAGELGE